MSVSGKSYGAAWHDLDIGRWSIASKLRDALVQMTEEPPARVVKVSHLTVDTWRCKVAREEGERVVTETRYLTEQQLRDMAERGVKVVG